MEEEEISQTQTQAQKDESPFQYVFRILKSIPASHVHIQSKRTQLIGVLTLRTKSIWQFIKCLVKFVKQYKVLCILLGCRDGSGVACRIVVTLLRGALVGREALDSWDVCTIAH